MKAAVKHATKLISLHFNDGITFKQLFEEMENEFSLIMSLEPKALLDSLRKIPELTFTESAEDITILADRTMQQYFSKSNVIKFYFSENEAFFSVIEGLYRIIILSKHNGITYQTLNEKYNTENKSAKLELPMMSHYCKKLEQCHLVGITHKENKRLVTAKLYMNADPLFPAEKKITRKPDEAYYNMIRTPGNSFLMRKMDSKSDEQAIQDSKGSIIGEDDNMNEESSQKDFGEDSSALQLGDPSMRKFKNLYEKSFTFRELTFIQNFYMNASGAEANIKKGHNQREVSQKLIKYGDKKM